MDKGLAELTTQIRPVVQDVATWGTISLAIATFLTDSIPPEHLITSVRGIVLQTDKVLVVQDEEDRYHVVPGGRREEEETITAALQREILEETGWRITNPVYLGFAHFHHLTPRPPDHKYPYPDFCQLYFAVQAEQFQPEKKLEASDLQKEYVLGVQWLPIDAAFQLPMDRNQYILLSVARIRQQQA